MMCVIQIYATFPAQELLNFFKLLWRSDTIISRNKKSICHKENKARLLNQFHKKDFFNYF